MAGLFMVRLLIVGDERGGGRAAGRGGVLLNPAGCGGGFGGAGFS